MTAGTGLKRTEHNGPKRGKGPDKKADVKRVSSRLRRVNDRKTAREGLKV